MAHTIVGRSAELGVLDGFLARTRAEPRVLVIAGEPGIGKTTLLGELIALARTRGYPVLACRPTRSEMDLSYAGLVELLSGLDDAIVGTLPGPQARVLRMILRTEEPEGRFDRLSLCVAMQAALRAAASAGPILLAVDDAQWLDLPSARTLAFAGRRLAGSPVRLAFTRRSGDPAEWLDELGRDLRPETVAPRPLGPRDLSRVLRTALGRAPAWPAVNRIFELSGGNPLYALELARAAVTAPTTGDLGRSLPGGVADLARARIAGLPARVRSTVEAASVPRTPTVALLRRLVPAEPDLTAVLAAAEDGGILTTDGGHIRFTHPILAAAAYGAIPAQRRRELHRAAADSSDDMEERARHLATASPEPDAGVADALAAAAQRAWRRGAPDAAAELLRLSCLHTPPAAAEALALRRIAYGRLLHSAGDAPGAMAELTTLATTLPHGLTRARALFHLMYVTRLSGSLGRALDHGLEAAREAEADPSFQAEVYELLSRFCDNAIDRKLETARLGLAALARVPDPDPYVVFHAQAALVEAEFYAGLGIHLDRLDGLPVPAANRFPPVRAAVRGEDLAGRLLAFSGRVDDGIATLQKLHDRSLIESRSILPAALGWMAEAELVAGRFTAAAELTREAIERAEEIGTVGGNPWEVGFHAIALTRLGRLDEAEATAARVAAMAAADPGVDLDELPATLALGLVALARGRFEEALTHLRLVDEAKRRAGIREPRFCSHASDLVDALVGAGAMAEAADVLARFEAEAETSGSPWSQGAAARCRAMVAAAQGDLEEALDAVRRSRSLLDDQPMLFEAARTLLVAGQIHRRRREKRLAREALMAAVEAFTALRTPTWAAKARSELARIPQRQRPSGLTPTEEMIARLAVEGLTNREIADRAFLSPKTVEVNLTRIYRKLGVRSRAALAGRFAAGSETAET